MKRILLPAALMSALFTTSCGPAAEDREMMHSRAKVFQDSIANMIRVSMAEAEAPGNAVMAPAPATQTAASTATVK